MAASDHGAHCFIAVAFGKDTDEHLRLDGWVDEVIRPIVVSLGLYPEVAALTSAPNAITLEIRTHLAFDKLAIVDLGGATADDAPNPNVMYELGVRHAFDLPTVVLAWDSQVLPFDIGEHRVIRSQRHFGTLKWHRDKLKAFAEAALEGDYFRPMQAVRLARIVDSAIEGGVNAPLAALSEQVKELRHAVESLAIRRPPSLVALEGLVTGYAPVSSGDLSKFKILDAARQIAELRAGFPTKGEPDKEKE